MKAFLLTAGNGTRLRPLTEENPKCLLPIQGMPLLSLWLENCLRSGINEVLINLHAHAVKVRDFIASNRGGPRVYLAEERELLGSAGTLAENRSFVKDEEGFFILYGDVLTNVCLAQMLAFHREKGAVATIGIYQVPDPHRCGIVSFDHEGTVRSFVEKPAVPKSNWAFSGIMIARPEIIDLVPPQRPADIGFHLLPQLVGQMAVYPIPGFLVDIGTLENYRAVQSSWPGLGGQRGKEPHVAGGDL
jgi:mannose-1-phosphate guanylyltransferase